MKYKLRISGQSAEFIGKQIKEEDFAKVTIETDLIEWSEEIGLDILEGDVFHFNKPIFDEDILFDIFDESDELVLSFSSSDIEQDVDDECLTIEYGIFLFVNVFLYSGEICEYELESDTIPSIEDFVYTSDCLTTETTEYDFLNNIYFRGLKLEPIEYLYSVNKAQEVHLFEYDF